MLRARSCAQASSSLGLGKGRVRDRGLGNLTSRALFFPVPIIALKLKFIIIYDFNLLC